MRFAIAAVVFFRFTNADFSTGNDLADIAVGSQKECEAECEKRKNCRGYVYSENLGRCWPKDNLGNIRHIDTYVEGGIKAELFNGR